MIALVDYGVGNLRSVEKALGAAGAAVLLTADPGLVLQAEKIVLPGVGAFGDGMDELRRRGLAEPVVRAVRAGTPLLGICLGMQLLFEFSEEMGEHRGLGLLPGRVRRFDIRPGLKIPQTGWNQVTPARPNALLDGLPPASYAYFNHGYYCEARLKDTLALTDYGVEFASVVGRERLYGVQFHPEKSQAVGLLVLRNFVERG